MEISYREGSWVPEDVEINRISIHLFRSINMAPLIKPTAC